MRACGLLGRQRAHVANDSVGEGGMSASGLGVAVHSSVVTLWDNHTWCLHAGASF
jgi:hypothetical protein